MSYRLKKNENVPHGIKRIVLEQIDRALDGIKSERLNRDIAIHDARVCFKKIRSALRLVRKQLDETFGKENLFYRDLGRKLSAVRNNTAIIESFDKLKEHFGGNVSPDVFTDLRKPFSRANSSQQTQKKRVLTEVAKLLTEARPRVQKWPLHKDDFTDLGEGLRQVYGRGLKSFVTAQGKPTVENLHEWRKSTKTLWYEVRLLKVLWPEPLGKLAEEIEALGNSLSDDHDLALLRQSIGKYSKDEDKGEMETLVALIDQRRLELQLQATLLGGRIYAERPRQFADRFAHYWKTWRSELKAEPKEVKAALVAKGSSRIA